MSSRTTWTILAPTFVGSGLLLIIGLGGAWYVHRANREVSDSLDENLAAAQSAERFVLAIRKLLLHMDRFVDTGEVSHLDAASVSLGMTRRDWSESGHVPNLEATDDVRFYEFADQIEQLRARPAGERGRDVGRELIASLSRELLAPAESLLRKRQQLATETSRKNQAAARRTGFGLLLLGLCGAIAGLLSGFGVARSVHRSLGEISVPVRDIAGRLDEVVSPIGLSSNSDFGELDDALRMLADKTADLVRQLQETQQQSIRREQLAAIGQLAAGLAHELRNPIMSMKLIVQTAAEREPQSLDQRDLRVFEGELTRLEGMLQSFLDFARPPQPEMRSIAIGPLVERTLDVVRLRADQQEVRLHYSAGQEPLWIEADEAKIRQVLLNLLLNALDVLPGGGNVWLDVRRDESPAFPRLAEGTRETQSNEAPCGAIRVTDDGPGVSADAMDRVFIPFVSTKDTGIGLGLAICRQIVESHGGCITVCNRAEGGAQFTVRIPLRLMPPEQARKPRFDDSPTDPTPARV